MPRDEAALPPIFHRSFDGGAARVLALHCGLGQSGMWKAVAAELAPLVYRPSENLLMLQRRTWQ